MHPRCLSFSLVTTSYTIYWSGASIRSLRIMGRRGLDICDDMPTGFRSCCVAAAVNVADSLSQGVHVEKSVLYHISIICHLQGVRDMLLVVVLDAPPMMGDRGHSQGLLLRRVSCRVLVVTSNEGVVADSVETGDGHLRHEELLGGRY